MRCSFCKKDITPGTGKLFIQNDGKQFHFCNSKCEKHQLKFKHRPNTTKWVKEGEV